MGTYSFSWPFAACEVYVTGTFDDWSKTVLLDKVGDIFEKTVVFPDVRTRVYYKFVVDGHWTTSSAAPQERDDHGNNLNVLAPKDIVQSVNSTKIWREGPHDPALYFVAAAIQLRDAAVQNLEYLAELGVDLARVFPDGRTALHIAAEVGRNAEALRYLCRANGKAEINRQDRFGWTPLHYAVVAEYRGAVDEPFEKIELLLRNGADPTFKASRQPTFYQYKMATHDFTCYGQCSSLNSDLLFEFVERVRRAGRQVPDEVADDLFVDARDDEADKEHKCYYTPPSQVYSGFLDLPSGYV